jgi:hypothetical protein
MSPTRRKLLTTAGVIIPSVSGCIQTSPPDDSDGGDKNNDDPLLSGGEKNPWNTDLISIEVVNETKSPRNFVNMVKEAINHWNSNMSELGLEGKLTTENTGNTNINIVITDDIESCGTEKDTDTIGCAPHYSSAGDAEGETTEVEIEAGYNRNTTVNIIQHEIGHTLGLKHSDKNEWPIMSPKETVAEVNQSTVYEKDNPWEKKEIKIYYQGSNGALNDAGFILQFDEAINFYKSETNYLPDDVTVSNTQQKGEAEIVVNVTSNISGQSTANWKGHDPDKDGKLESYTEGEIKINKNIDSNTSGWHLGYWLGMAFAPRSPSELPEPFQDPNTTNKSNWNS